MRAQAASFLFSRTVETWGTPRAVYDALDREFHFTLDPCPLMPAHQAGLPLFGTDGLSKSWSGERVFCNPPYGRGTGDWLAKAREPDCAVYLLPARTETVWWHRYAMGANEIRFIRGRLYFETPDGTKAPTGAPFPSVVLVYQRDFRRMHPRVTAWSPS
jgi:site-specific DNA-methyltransferase (adenine-specific)